MIVLRDRRNSLVSLLLGLFPVTLTSANISSLHGTTGISIDIDMLPQLFGYRDLLWAIIGALLAVSLDRLWRRIESRPRFRIQVGRFEDIALGSGINLTITNVGFNPLPEYDVGLFHPKRGTLRVFHNDRKDTVFPQYPEQWNSFQCTTGPLHSQRGWQPQWEQPPPWQTVPDFVRGWFLTIENKPISAPSFTEFQFRLVLKNSDLVLFQDEELGNSLAKELFESVAGRPVEQEVKHVFYKSKAPFWIEWIRSMKIRRSLHDLKRSA